MEKVLIQLDIFAVDTEMQFADFSGNTIIEFEGLSKDSTSFGDTTKEIAVRMKGADSKVYYTVYDSTGKRKYEPVQIHYSYPGTSDDSYQGFIFTDEANEKHILNQFTIPYARVNLSSDITDSYITIINNRG